MRILVASDQRLITETLAEFLKHRLGDADVTGVTSLDHVFKLMDEGASPDLVLLDRHLQGMDRIETVAALCEKSPGVRVVLMVETPGRQLIRTAFAQGAAGIVLKNISGTAMIKVLELVLVGETYAPPILEPDSHGDGEVGGVSETADSDAARQFSRLTPRERQVLTLILKGYSNKEIAHELKVKEITAAFHLRGLFKKLGVSNRTQAATKALQSGWTRI